MTEIFLYGVFGCDFTAKQIADELKAADGDVNLHIASVGGSVGDATAIFSQVKQYSKGTITAKVDGFCFSAASYVVCAADKVVAARDSEFMIHEASSGAWGTAEELKTVADSIEKLNQTMAKAYAAKTGQDEATIKADMAATIFMTPQEAMEYGLVDEIDDYSENAQAKMPYDFAMTISDGKIENVPDRIMAMAMSVIVEKAATPAKPPEARKDEAMAEEVNGGNTAAEVTQAMPAMAQASDDLIKNERERVSMIMAAGQKMEISQEKIQAYVDNGIDAATAQSEMLSAWEKEDPAQAIDPVGANVKMVADGVEKRNKGIEEALVFQMTGTGDVSGNEFVGRSVRSLASACLPENEKSNFFGMNNAAQVDFMMSHSTSDFPNILTGSVGRVLETLYKESPETFEAWAGAETVPDFREKDLHNVGSIENLKSLGEKGEVQYTTFETDSRTIKIASYALGLKVSRQMLVNDDLGVIRDVVSKFSISAKRTIGDMAYQVLIDNAKYTDGKSLFHSNHGNLLSGASSALSFESLTSLRTKMRQQKDGQGHKLNIVPEYLIISPTLETTARTLLGSTAQPDQANSGVANIVRDYQLKLVVDSRLDDLNGGLSWFLAAGYNRQKTIAVGYLNGKRTPTLYQNNEWNGQGRDYNMIHDFGVSVADYRGLAKAVGS